MELDSAFPDLFTSGKLFKRKIAREGLRKKRSVRAPSGGDKIRK